MQTISENAHFDGGTNVLHHQILYSFGVCVSGEELEAPPVTPPTHSSVRLLFGPHTGVCDHWCWGRERNGANWGEQGEQYTLALRMLLWAQF